MRLKNKLVMKVLNFLDNFKTRKIFIKIKKYIKDDSIIFDIGSHYGETIILIDKYFSPLKVYGFEISKDNFKIMKNKIKNKNFSFELFNFNYGFSNKKNIDAEYLQAEESSSSTIEKINKKSKYFKKKLQVLGKKNNFNFFKKKRCELETLSNFIIKNNIKKIDLLKIDTEGHEFKILQGSNNDIKKIHIIYFEHHYDNMLQKNYKFSDINYLLKQKGFEQLYKSKMFFRKTFEYVYKNKYL